MSNWLEKHLPKIVLAPSFIAIILFVYGFIAWTAWVSFTKSRLMPKYDIVGFINHSLDNNLIGAFNLVGSELTTHDTFFKSILKHKKSIISWVIFLPKFLIKFIFGNMSEMFLYGPKTKPARTLESNYQFKYSSLQEALLNLTE